MRIIILLTALCIFWTLLSCDENNSNIFKSKIEENLLQSLHNPDSYEFVRMSEIDTLYAKDYYSNMYEIGMGFQKRMISNPDPFTREKVEKQFKGHLSNPKVQKYLKTADSIDQAIQDRHNQTLLYKDSLSQTDSKAIREFHTQFSFRANNAMGAKSIHHYNVVFNSEKEIIDMELINNQS